MFMLLEAKRWIERELPWWGRKQGADHIWSDSAPLCYGCSAMTPKPLRPYQSHKNNLKRPCPVGVLLSDLLAGLMVKYGLLREEKTALDGVQACDA